MMLLAPYFTQYFLTEQTLSRGDLLKQLGLKWCGLHYALVIPLFLTAVLFLGPLTMQFLSGVLKLYAGMTKLRYICQFRCGRYTLKSL